MQLRRVADYLVYLVVRVLICVVQSLRMETCQTACRWLAVLFNDVLKIRRRVVEENLSYAFPEMTSQERLDLSRRMWEHLFLLVVEVAHAPRRIYDTNWRDYIDLVNREMLVNALFDDRPVIILSAHYGNFELSGYIMGMLGFPSSTIARPLDNPYLDRFLNQFRGAKGQTIMPKNGSAQQMDALLASGGTLVLLADQHAGPKGCWVDFFGRPASTHKAIALLSLGNDAPLLLCYSQRSDRPLYHWIGAEAMADPRTLGPEEATIPALTQWYTSTLERIIRRAPEQYWWLHRRWKDTRPKRPARTKAA